MKQRKEAIYPIEPWTITEKEFRIADNYRNETTFSLSNGYIGTRGTMGEGYDFSLEEGLEGNFINGFYESEEIRYGEWNFGFPQKSQSLLNVCNGKNMRILIEGEAVDIRIGSVEGYARTLHMKEGVVTREFVWCSPQGNKISLKTERLVSFEHKNIMVERLTLCPFGTMQIKVESHLDAEVENHTRKTNPLVDYGPFGKRLIKDKLWTEKEGAYYEGTTLHSKLSMACRIFHQWNKEPDAVFERVEEEKAYNDYCFVGQEKEEIILDKFIIYTSSLDLEKREMESFTEQTKYQAMETGFVGFKKQQIAYMQKFWDRADVKIEGNDALQQGIRFNLFHIMQAAGRDGRTGMGAKGLSGEGYEGHYFWDTEMYIMPVFVYTNPELAKSLLDYRFSTLKEARERARVLGHEKGALYPWRTINGEEASTYFPLGTAQYHINGDIAYAFWLYLTVTQDWNYLKEKGAEVLCETARVYADVGCFAECKGGKYCICSVTGPDEYNAIVDNNFYTNLMARENIRYASKALALLKEQDANAHKELVERLGITEEEIATWQNIIDNMYFPYDEKRKIYPLDDGFMMRKPWDDSRIPAEKRHLLYENYHPLFIYRQRMSKQADAILGMFLHSNYFKQEELKRNYDFYQEVTLHHSSLSTCIFGIVACETGDYQDACQYFWESARMDLDDYHENFYAGIHAANMAGTWQAMIHGFAGLRTNAGVLSFKPFLPNDMTSYTFQIGYQGKLLKIEVRKKEAQFTLLQGENLIFYCNKKEMKIKEKGGHCIESISSNLF